MSMVLKLLRKSESVNFPIKAGPLEAGIDFFCPQETFLRPGSTTKIPLGFAVEIPEGFFMKFFDRSSIASLGIFTSAGVIDCTYRGELAVLMYNSTYDGYQFGENQKIVQAVLLPVPDVTLMGVNALSNTDRGSGGFGSTNKPAPPKPVPYFDVELHNRIIEGCFP